MALAKVGGLDPLFRLFPKILTPPAVYHELVTAGLDQGAPDASLLAACYNSNQLEVKTPAGTTPLPIPALLGAGEERSILLAIEQKATWLFIDDLGARRAALANFREGVCIPFFMTIIVYSMVTETATSLSHPGRRAVRFASLRPFLRTPRGSGVV